MEQKVTTRKQLIIHNYLILEKELKNHFAENLFPSLEDIDVADLVFYITLMFSGISTKDEYIIKIKEIIEGTTIKVSDELLEQICNPIMTFIEWLKFL
jgi:uncharacterized protein YuzB (UPF0349 family)